MSLINTSGKMTVVIVCQLLNKNLMKGTKRNLATSTGGGWSNFLFRGLPVLVLLILCPWSIYYFFSSSQEGNYAANVLSFLPFSSASSLSPTTSHNQRLVLPSYDEVHILRRTDTKRTPALGPTPTNGTKPIFGKHKGTDAIFALACKYPVSFYKRFVGSLRKFGYTEDIVLAVSPPQQMKPGVEEYVKQTQVVAYGFDVDCAGKDNCRLKDDFLGYPDPRPMRTFANIRYALYEYWLQYYNDQSYILILDFRDTFFQSSPFVSLPPYGQRTGEYNLMLFAENWKVKTIGKCKYNSLWIARCFGKDALPPLREQAVICSGSTMGSYQAVSFYVDTMLKSMDKVQCWKKGIESDQGYQNYLFYNGYFNTSLGNATLYYQGNGPVNTIGAMNGFRVPKDQKGPLDTFWKIRDSDGFILNNDGTRSSCIHQWDRFYAELYKWLDKLVADS